ncbi:MAG TPA: ion transporter [Candidatus Mailhella excrementigallinarum]|nr:MAG: ion transporter [Desulfovibrionaceae bacterium]HIV65160.1 ion transporter [Candidatus Mailhella excrementigallinarum]
MPFHPLFSRLIAFHRMLHGIRYELLLGSLLCVFVLNMLFPSNIYGGIAQFLYLPFQLLAALALFETNRILLRVFLCCAAGLMFCRVAGFLLPFEFEPGLTGLYFAFFAGVTGELFRQLWRMSNAGREAVYAGLSGFLLLGYCSYFLFLGIEFHTPGSFSGLGRNENIMNDLFYFSYITILTVGYGDIVPVSWVARNATILAALAGNMYSLVVISSIVSRAGSSSRR